MGARSVVRVAGLTVLLVAFGSGATPGRAWDPAAGITTQAVLGEAGGANLVGVVTFDAEVNEVVETRIEVGPARGARAIRLGQAVPVSGSLAADGRLGAVLTVDPTGDPARARLQVFDERGVRATADVDGASRVLVHGNDVVVVSRDGASPARRFRLAEGVLREREPLPAGRYAKGGDVLVGVHGGEVTIHRGAAPPVRVASAGVTGEALSVSQDGSLIAASDGAGVMLLDPSGRRRGHIAVPPGSAPHVLATAPDGGGVVVVARPHARVRELASTPITGGSGATSGPAGSGAPATGTSPISSGSPIPSGPGAAGGSGADGRAPMPRPAGPSSTGSPASSGTTPITGAPGSSGSGAIGPGASGAPIPSTPNPSGGDSVIVAGPDGDVRGVYTPPRDQDVRSVSTSNGASTTSVIMDGIRDAYDTVAMLNGIAQMIRSMQGVIDDVRPSRDGGDATVRHGPDATTVPVERLPEEVSGAPEPSTPGGAGGTGSGASPAREAAAPAPVTATDPGLPTYSALGCVSPEECAALAEAIRQAKEVADKQGPAPPSECAQKIEALDLSRVKNATKAAGCTDLDRCATESLLRRVAREEGIDETFFLAVAVRESTLRHWTDAEGTRPVRGGNSYGVMQCDESNFRNAGGLHTRGHVWEEVKADPLANARCGAAILKECGGAVRAALAKAKRSDPESHARSMYACYNGGPDAAGRPFRGPSKWSHHDDYFLNEMRAMQELEKASPGRVCDLVLPTIAAVRQRAARERYASMRS